MSTALDFEIWMNLYAKEISRLIKSTKPVDEPGFVEAMFLGHEEIVDDAPITSSSDPEESSYTSNQTPPI